MKWKKKKEVEATLKKMGYIMFHVIDYLKWKKKKFESNHWVTIPLVLSCFFEEKNKKKTSSLNKEIDFNWGMPWYYQGL